MTYAETLRAESIARKIRLRIMASAAPLVPIERVRKPKLVEVEPPKVEQPETVDYPESDIVSTFKMSLIRTPFEGTQRLLVSDVIRAAAEHFYVSEDQLRGKKRLPSLVLARHTISYICHVISGRSQAEIGRELRNHHSTVWHGINVIRDRFLEGCPKTFANVEAVIELVNKSPSRQASMSV